MKEKKKSFSKDLIRFFNKEESRDHSTYVDWTILYSLLITLTGAATKQKKSRDRQEDADLFSYAI